jgi:hypothetical protein
LGIRQATFWEWSNPLPFSINNTINLNNHSVSTSNKSFRVQLRTISILYRYSREGLALPVSHFDTVFWSTCNFSANCFWFMCFSIRRSRIRGIKFIFTPQSFCILRFYSPNAYNSLLLTMF